MRMVFWPLVACVGAAAPAVEVPAPEPEPAPEPAPGALLPCYRQQYTKGRRLICL
jgi:hypothetical protein